MLEWLPGRSLAGDLAAGGAALAGAALARLHASSPVLPALCTRAPEPFCRREPYWAACVMELLAMAESRLGA